MMKVRKLFTCVCVLCLLISVCSAQAAGKPIVKSASRMHYAVSNQLLWTVSENGQVSCYDLEKYIKTDVITLEYVSHLSADDQTLYCLTDNGNERNLYFLTPSTVEASPVALDTDFGVRQMEASGMLYLLGDNGRVYQAIRRGAESPYLADLLSAPQWENEHISAIAVYNEYLCTYSEETGVLSLLDSTIDGGMQLLYLPVKADGLKYIQIGQSTDGVQHIYALRDAQEGTGLLDINLQTGEAAVSALDFPESCIGLRRSQDALYTLSADGTALYAVSIKAKSGKTSGTLTLLNAFYDLKYPSVREAEAYERFYARYPDIQLVAKSENDLRVVATGIMAGTEGYDITSIQENMTVISSMDMYLAGASVNLEEIPEVAQVLSQCADVLSPVSAEGHLIGIPVFCQPYLWSVNEQLAAELDLQIPRDGWTWDDFFALGEKVQKYNSENGKKICLLRDNTGSLPYFLVQYNANTVDLFNGTAAYDDADFIQSLTRWTQLCKDGLVLSRNEDADAQALLCCEKDTHYYSIESGECGTLILPPVFNAQTRYPVDVTRTVINANTPYLEAAEYLISCLFTADALRDSAFVSNNGYLLQADMEKDLTDDPSGNKQVWYAVLQNAVQDYYIGDLYRDQRKELYPQLLNGEITPEEYAQTCQMRAEMVLGE